MNKIPVSYLQVDKRWSNMDYSAKGEKTTIGKAGCGPTACAMVIASLADSSVTPVNACTYSLAHGFKAKNQGTYYSFIRSYLQTYGIEAVQLNTSSVYKKASADAHIKALKAIQDGDWVICCMGKGNWTSSGHFILWYDVEGQLALVKDPNSTKTSRTRNKTALLQSEVKYYWHIKVSDFLKKRKDADEVITEREINIFGKDIKTEGILKEGKNFLSPRMLEQVGLKVTNEGSKPVIKMNEVSVSVNGKTTVVNGFSANGTNYVPIRAVAELLNHSVAYDQATKSVIIK